MAFTKQEKGYKQFSLPSLSLSFFPLHFNSTNTHHIIFIFVSSLHLLTSIIYTLKICNLFAKAILTQSG